MGYPYGVRNIACVFIALMAFGCTGETELPVYPVAGTVSFNGQPVPEASIVFEDASGLPPDAGSVLDGEFSLSVKAGKKIVRIRASRVIEGKEDAGIPGTPLRVDYIPAKYNTNSELFVTVDAEDTNEFEFKLVSP